VGAIGVTGGNKLEAALRNIADKLAKASKVNVGFLEDATYPDGTPIAYIAAVNEFGGTATIPAHTQTVFRQTNKAGTGFNKKGRFVKESEANFASDHQVEEYTVTIPARPFFRTTVKDGSKHWGEDLGKILKANGYDAANALGQMGEEMKGELQASIQSWSDPPNAKSTVAKKGFNKPLIEDGTMMRAVDSEVE
jgi:hypothetical protein